VGDVPDYSAGVTPSGVGFKLLERSGMNSRSSEMGVAGVLSELDAEQKWVLPVVMVGLHR
jgi:hypothetical protein